MEPEFLRRPRDRKLEESVIEAFDSVVSITWDVGRGQVGARFQAKDSQVTVKFLDIGNGAWRASLEADRSRSTGRKGWIIGLYILGGVFKATREFLEFRQPQKLVFVSNDESLAQLYDTYLQDPDSALKQMGYGIATPIQSSPLTEFSIVKKGPSEWKEA